MTLATVVFATSDVVDSPSTMVKSFFPTGGVGEGDVGGFKSS